MYIDKCKPGQRVRIRQTIERREGDWHGAVEGVIAGIDLQKTGSWYAHSKEGQFWLRRVRLIKDDGEVTLLNIDSRTEVEVLESGPTRA